MLHRFIFICLILTPVLASAQTGSENNQNRPFYQISSQQENFDKSINLSTPQACLENFILSCKQDNYARAAASLDTRFIDDHNNTARELSKKFFYVLNQKTIIPWKSIPDRPDGLSNNNITNKVSGDNRNILLDTINHQGRDIEIRLYRVKFPQYDPFWLFSPNTVENIETLYSQFGPGILDKRLPEWVKIRMWGNLPVWEWIMLFLILAISAVAGWLAQKFITFLLIRSSRKWSRGLAESIPLPIAFTLCLIIFYIATIALLSLTGPFAAFFNPVMSMLIIIAMTWLLMRIITFFSTWVINKYSEHLLHTDQEDNARAGQMLTYTTIIQKVLIFIAIFFGLGIALSQFKIFQTLATSMLASAGVASVIIGIAAHGILSNIMAGIQIALTQPINIGDNVYFEGNWGNIEAISYNYVTILTWDQRRIIVPLNYLLSNPIENWSKKDSHLIKPITFHVDYRVDVAKIRQKFQELLENSEEWDREQNPSIQVLECKAETMVIRALCSAKNPSAAWVLHCKLREELNKFIQQLDNGDYLPKKRLYIQNDNLSNTSSDNESA